MKKFVLTYCRVSYLFCAFDRSFSYASLGISLVNYLPVTEVIIIDHSLFTSKQEAMVPVNVVRIEG